MMVTRLIIPLVILAFCCADPLNEIGDRLNSRQDFANTVQGVLKSKDNRVSKECKIQLGHYVNGLKNRRKWALQMFDATSKLPSGIMDGNFVDLGFFDECLAVEGNITTITSSSEIISGQYCLATLPLGKVPGPSANINFEEIQPVPRVITPDLTMGPQFSICIPNACSPTDLESFYAGIGFTVKFYEKMCQTKSEPPKLDSGAIATISFLGIVLWLMICCTGYDAFLHYTGRTPPSTILVAFSVITNGRKLLKTTYSPNQISCLHGIRVISTMWVILGHRYVSQTTAPVRNMRHIAEWAQTRGSLYIQNAPLSVDTFFLMSGLVVAYIYMCTMSKGIKFNVLVFYFHRYVRLTPVLAVIILIHVTLFQHFGSGPIYPQSVDNMLVAGCEKYWWKALLYVQNYGQGSIVCVTQSWYLNVDTQLYFLSPIILIPLKRWPINTLIFTGFLTLCSMVACFVTGWIFELNGSFLVNMLSSNYENYWSYYYSATQTRAAPWLIGIVLGYYIYQVKQGSVRVKAKQWVILVVWIVSLLVLFTCLFTGLHLLTEEYDKLKHSFYLTLVRPAWAVALSWIIFACVTGHGGPVNWFLSLPIFQVLSKFTYTLYLVHLQLIVIANAQMRSPATFSDAREMHVFWGDFAFSLFFAVLLTLAFESPIISIEQFLMRRKKKTETKLPEPGRGRYVEKSVEIA